jgi:AraC-like DNA-binding protein
MSSLAANLDPRMRLASMVDYPPGATFGPRTLDDFELVWLLSGSAVWRCGDAVEELGPGSLLLGRPGMRDSYTWDRYRTTRHAYVHFALDHDGANWPLVRHLVYDDPLAGLFRYLLWLGGATPTGWRERGNDVLRLLLATFVDGPLPETDDVLPLPAPIEAVVEHLRQAWSAGVTRPLSLTELASAASVSGVHLSRLFRARFGVGPVTAVELLRLGRAETLLLRSNSPIASISANCGFADPYHFSRRFRAVYGVPPSVFRSAGLPAAPPSPVVARGLLPLERQVWRPL